MAGAPVPLDMVAAKLIWMPSPAGARRRARSVVEAPIFTRKASSSVEAPPSWSMKVAPPVRFHDAPFGRNFAVWDSAAVLQLDTTVGDVELAVVEIDVLVRDDPDGAVPSRVGDR